MPETSRLRASWPSTLLTLLSCALVWGASACSDATEGQHQADVGASDVEQELPPKETPLEQLSVETGVSKDGPAAGEQVQVFCTVQGLADGQEAPATRWEIFQAPEGASPPTLQGEHVVFETAGEYRVRCQIEATGWTDPTPSKVLVHPGVAVEITTAVSPSVLKAGQTATATCHGVDAYGNDIEDGWLVLIASGGAAPGPDGGLVEANFAIKALSVGTYIVVCAQKGGATDDAPVLVTVEHGLPYRLVTTLGSPSIVAGHDTSVACHAEDKHGNVVPDLPMAIDLPSSLGLLGLKVTGTTAGKFNVRCVPVGLDWGAFVIDGALLEVLPDAPVTLALQAQPPKPFFPVYELVQIQVIAHDQYGNLVPDAPVLPLEVSPDQDHKKQSATSFLFYVEGYYLITGRLENDPSVVATLELAIEGSPPAVTVLHPLRGATIQNSKPSLTVEGIANDTIAGIAAVRVNGQPAKLNEDGSFTRIIIPQWGLNVLKVEAEDDSGSVTTITQSFYFAELWYPLKPELPFIPDALKVWLAKDFIDDGVHNPTHPDDLATILEGVVASFDINSALPPKIEVSGDYDLKMSNFKMNPPKLSLTPKYGGLGVYFEAKNASMKLKLEGECKVLGVDLCPDLSGSISIDKLKLWADLLASAANAVLNVSLANPKVELEYIDVNIDGILGWLFDWLIDFVVNIFTGTIEDAFEDQLAGQLEDTLGGLLESLALSETFEMEPLMPGMPPLSLTLDSRIHSLAFTPDGGRLGLGARFLASQQVPHTILGSIGRGTCVKGYPISWSLPGASEFEVGLFDDFLNLALTALWYSGVTNLTLDESSLGDEGLDLGGLPIDSITITTDFLLPPILNGCDPSGIVKLQIGDLFVDVELESFIFGDQPGKMGVYIAAELSAELVMIPTDEGDAIAIVPLGLDTLEYHWAYVPEAFEGAEEALEELLEAQLIDGVLADMLGKPLGNIVVPELDMHSMSPMFAEGTVIVPIVEALTRQGGHTFMQGYLE